MVQSCFRLVGAITTTPRSRNSKAAVINWRNTRPGFNFLWAGEGQFVAHYSSSSHAFFPAAEHRVINNVVTFVDFFCHASGKS